MGDKVCTLSHTYMYILIKNPEKNEVAIFSHQADSPLRTAPHVIILIISLVRRLCFWWHGFVFLFVSNITQKFVNGLRWNFMESSGVVKGTSNWILVVTRITMLTAQSEIWPLPNNIWVDFDEIFRISLHWYKEQIDQNFGVTWITMLTLQIGNAGNMGVMSCLGQGGLCYLSALCTNVSSCWDIKRWMCLKYN